MEQKKKSNNYIIPATFFTSLAPTKKPVPTIKSAKNPIEREQTILKKEETPTVPKLKEVKRRPSALSLKSIHQKKEAKVISTEEENFDNHPKTLFNEEQLKSVWKKYYFKLQELGEKNIASILITDTPKLNPNFQIVLTLPNDLMKSQLERGKPKLLSFLREHLNNYGISMTIEVNEVIEKKKAYTTIDKYNKLKEKNPLLEKLKNTFGLDI